MPPITDRADLEKEPRLGGGGPGKTPHWHDYGGDDGDNDGGEDDFLSSRRRLRRYRVLLVLVIASVFTLFVAAALCYIVRGRSGPYDPVHHRFLHPWKPLALPYGRMFLNTLVLLLSSLTLELSRRGMGGKLDLASMGIEPPRWQMEMVWLALTVILGFGFLAGQIAVWRVLQAQGVYFAWNLVGSSFYFLTGLHALHLMGGLLALVYALVRSRSTTRFVSRHLVLEATAWYWHFMGVLWVGVFALLHFAK